MLINKEKLWVINSDLYEQFKSKQIFSEIRSAELVQVTAVRVNNQLIEVIFWTGRGAHGRPFWFLIRVILVPTQHMNCEQFWSNVWMRLTYVLHNLNEDKVGFVEGNLGPCVQKQNNKDVIKCIHANKHTQTRHTQYQARWGMRTWMKPGFASPAAAGSSWRRGANISKARWGRESR